jgi:peptidoglycan hydrolase CwlO-like protein
MYDKEYKDIQNKLDNLKNELGEYMSKCKSQVDSIERATADLADLTELEDIRAKLKVKIDNLEKANEGFEEKIDQLDTLLGFWDTIPKKKIDYKADKTIK